MLVPIFVCGCRWLLGVPCQCAGLLMKLVRKKGQTPTKHFEMSQEAAQTVSISASMASKPSDGCELHVLRNKCHCIHDSTQNTFAVCLVVWRAAGMIAHRACESHDKYAILRVSAAMQCCFPRTCVHVVEFQHTHIHAQNTLSQKLFKVLPSSWWSTAYNVSQALRYCKSSVLLDA